MSCNWCLAQLKIAGKSDVPTSSKSGNVRHEVERCTTSFVRLLIRKGELHAIINLGLIACSNIQTAWLARTSSGFCSFIDPASKLAETLKSKLVEMNGSRMTGAEWDFPLFTFVWAQYLQMSLALMLILLHAIFMKGRNLCSPIKKPDLSGCPNGSFHHMKQCEQWLSLHKIQSPFALICMHVPYWPGFKHHQGLSTRH